MVSNWSPACTGWHSRAVHRHPRDGHVRSTVATALAGTEVLMAAVLHPAWMKQWGGEAPNPFMAGLTLGHGASSPNVPYLARISGAHITSDRRSAYTEVRLSAFWANDSLDSWCSPTVREV